MRMLLMSIWLLSACCLADADVSRAESPSASPQVTFDAPEAVLWDAGSQTWFVSSLGNGVSLEKDGYGWISRLDVDGNVLSAQWVSGLDAPTGMDVIGEMLFVGDRGRIVVIDVPTATIVREIELPDAEFVNDVSAGSGGTLYVSDFFGNKIFRINSEFEVDVLVESADLGYPNGLWADGERLYFGSWGNIIDKSTFETDRLGTIKYFDLKTKEIVAVGQGRPIANFDGIVRYGDVTFGTDWSGGRLLSITDQGEVRELLTGFSQFAGLGFDPERKMFVIPEMSKDRMIILRGESVVKGLR